VEETGLLRLRKVERPQQSLPARAETGRLFLLERNRRGVRRLQ
jgi:hypothetical protein